MIEVFVTVNFKDRNYQTNVIVNKDMAWEKIKRIAEEQVKKTMGYLIVIREVP
jgi:predicted transcriptional regulator